MQICKVKIRKKEHFRDLMEEAPGDLHAHIEKH